FILDANRSSPLAFTLSTVFATAALSQAKTTVNIAAVSILLVAIVVLNSTVLSLGLLVFAAFLLVVQRFARGPQIGAIVGLSLLILIFPPLTRPLSTSDQERSFLTRVKTETPRDSLFIIPPSLLAFRHYAQRSAYVDFKLFSVAQPNQASLTRARMDEINFSKIQTERDAGWDGVERLDEETHSAATCENMNKILSKTGADYYVRLVSDENPAPECTALGRPILGETLALYGPRE
ncbi:MAG: DUF6798 domain-containing protein, partial [Pseudomonadota bacterium]